MPSGSVVKRFNVIEDIFLGQITRFVDAFFDSFFFKTAKKGLGYPRKALIWLTRMILATRCLPQSSPASRMS